MAGNWKVLRTGLTTLADADWSDDVSDALPSTGLATLYGGTDGPEAIEFVVLAYLASDTFLSDVGTETFSAQLTLLIDPPAGSSIGGRDEADEQIAIATVNSAGLLFHKIYRVNTSGASSFTLRLHTLSGTPGDADRYEVLWREV